MIGCGHFPENELMLYVDGNHGEPASVESHLRTCAECMKDVLALNRLEAQSRDYAGGPVPKPGLVSVLREKGSRLFRDLASSSGLSRLVAGVSTRGSGGSESASVAEFTLEEPPVTVRVWEEEGKFQVRLEGRCLSGQTVALRKTGDDIPLLTLTAPVSGPVHLKSLSAGRYDVLFAAGRVRILLRDADDHTGT